MRVERGSGRFRVNRIFYKVNFLLGHLRSTDISFESRMNEKKYIGNSLKTFLSVTFYEWTLLWLHSGCCVCSRRAYGLLLGERLLPKRDISVRGMAPSKVFQWEGFHCTIVEDYIYRKCFKWFVRKYEYGGSETADEISITADVRNSAEPTDVYERGNLTEIRNNEGDLQKVLGRYSSARC